jgi:DNA polymerase III sliding clamp (beta) subunit (PCNA family)
VATDRYRMAVARGTCAGHGGGREQVLVPTPLVDAMRALLGDDEPARFVVEAGRVTLEAGERRVSGQLLAHDFPDYRRLVQLPAGRRVVVDVPALREALETGPVRAAGASEPSRSARDVSVLATADDGTVTVRGDGDEDGNSVGVDRGFLLDALAAADRDRLVLEFGAAPTAPLAVRRTDDQETFSLLMPVRLDD